MSAIETVREEARRNPQTGIVVARIDEEILRESCELEGVQVEGLTAVQASVKLHAHYAKQGKEMALCDAKSGCQGYSPKELDRCPYCGCEEVADEEPKQTSKAIEKAKPVQVVEAEPVDDTRVASELRTERDLDARVERIRRYKGAAAVSGWHVGRELAECHEKREYLLRLDEKGKPRWKNFESFCLAEVSLTPAYCRELIAISRRYSEEQAMALGATKLILLLQAPPEREPELRREAEEGLSKAELEAKVRAANKAVGERVVTGSDGVERTVGNGGAKPKKPKSHAAEPVRKVAAAVGLSKHTVKAWKRPDKPSAVEGEEGLVPMKRLADVPWGRLELENGVLTIELRENASGSYVFKLAFAHNDEEG